MATKLGKNEYPSGHSAGDFDCFGPVATKDGEFDGTKLADMGCFKQDKVDSNKFYHLCVCKSKINSGWYTMFEWGRVGKSTTIQFTECSSENEAQAVFEKQAHAKNDKRGVWDTVAGMKVLVPKPGKDVYLVQANDSRSWGLTDARGIATEGTTVKKKIKTAAKKASIRNAKPKAKIQSEVSSLLRDINVATVQYTRTQIKGDYLPSQVAIDEARDILAATMKQIMVVGHDTEDQVNDPTIKQLTNTLYSRIPKEKKLRAAAQDWILNQDNVDLWNLDLDAFESALGAAEVIEQKDDVGVDPYGGMPITMEWMGSSRNPITPMAEWLTKWMPKASKDKHSYLGSITLKNVWKINRKGSHEALVGQQRSIGKTTSKERPLFQVKSRPDLTKTEQQAYHDTNTALLFHGTRSVNVRGILESSLRLPRQLVGVTTNGAMFGPGLYFADDFKKSIGYTSHGGGLYSGGSGGMRSRSPFMFLADVALGTAHVAKSSNGWTKSPAGTHSVFGKGGKTKSWGGHLVNNEFIVYKTQQHNLRYLVEFDC
jgi:predicted DNA-binding WGR domain protein